MKLFPLTIIVVLVAGLSSAQQATTKFTTTRQSQLKTINPKSAPIFKRINDQLYQVDVARATGKITKQQAIDIVNKINVIHHEVANDFRDNRKARGQSDLTDSQLSTLNSELDKTARLIPIRSVSANGK